MAAGASRMTYLAVFGQGVLLRAGSVQDLLAFAVQDDQACTLGSLVVMLALAPAQICHRGMVYKVISHKTQSISFERTFDDRLEQYYSACQDQAQAPDVKAGMLIGF
ncbi:MAG: hypothetical protein FRX49_11230 [Trebouxia sp. A1-2]|nr:MAG: hypothetical protein FRX49_11230 [Trebouxia sp. A1-2]